jgi:Ca2+-binding EF-hand superfamily protein
LIFFSKCKYFEIVSFFDNDIIAKELKNVMKKLGQTLSDDEVNLMIQEADTDGDRKVNYKGIFNKI